jgi:hypothetical protein
MTNLLTNGPSTGHVHQCGLALLRLVVALHGLDRGQDFALDRTLFEKAAGQIDPLRERNPGVRIPGDLGGPFGRLGLRHLK